MSIQDLLLRKTLTVLKQIATDCGIASSGTKPILAQRISQDLSTPLLQPVPNGTPHRVLSIDMGIRNLAVCLLHIRNSGIPQISHWNRVTVSHKPDENTVESFEPTDYADKAYTLINSSLERYNPHTILIERQRYRSGGGAAVQEWTVRVNMLESMFHAVLHTLARTAPQNFIVHSVSPRKITRLWLADIVEKMNARETKLAKIDVAQRIAKGKVVDVEFVGQAEEIAGAFRDGRKKGEVKKLDDFADAMLQGLGWWTWHVNRLKMTEEILDWEDAAKPRASKKNKAEDGDGSKMRRRRIKSDTIAAVNDPRSAGDLTVLLQQKPSHTTSPLVLG